MAEIPQTGTIIVGVEIANHPQPYSPPLFRSADGGVTWQDVSVGQVLWHIISLQVNPANQHVYGVAEGLGVYRSMDDGLTWQPLKTYFALTILIDPLHPGHMFGGNSAQWSHGGLWASGDEGITYTEVGMSGKTILDIALNGSSTAM